jgi:repressor LexA
MLTGRQQEIWEFLAEYVGKHGYPPTVREIGESVGLASPSTVHAHLANLERALELLRDRPVAAGAAAEVHKLPLLGSIAAGAPLLAEEHVDEYLAVPEPLSNGGEEFLLRIRGDSMIDAGILDGDIVVIRKSPDARNGEIVAALVGDDESANEATVKRFYKEGSRIRLQPENQSLDPLYPAHVQILGKVVGVFRSL